MSYHVFFDKSANWNGDEKLVDSNSYDIGIGLEYDIMEAFMVSAGYLRTQVGVSDAYQSDFTHELSSNGVGAGMRIKLADRMALELGGIYIKYDDASRSATIEDYPLPVTESYKRDALGFAVGIEFGF